VPTAVVRAAPINNEYNALRDAFAQATGHKHDGTAAEGAYIPLISDTSAYNKIVVDSTNNKLGFFVNVSSAAVEQAKLTQNVFAPVTTDVFSLGTSVLKFKDLYLSGTGTIPTLTTSSATITGGTINNTVIGGTTPLTITGTTITANTGFVGGLTGNVTGNVTGNLTGSVTGNVTGNLTGNVTAGSGTSTFTNVTISGVLNMDSSTNGANTITGLTAPVNGSDAATKTYVDSAISSLVNSAPGALDTLAELATALGNDASFSTTVTNSLATKLALAGGTMSGTIAMGTYKITGLGTPTANTDAATKGYIDSADALKLNLSGGTMSGSIAMGTNTITGLGNPSNAQDAATKTYVDGILGSATAAATSASAAATSATNAATSASNASTSASSASASAASAATSYDNFDDRYLGDKASNPTVDNDGNALLTGALYFNTTSNEMRVYTGSTWLTAYLPATGYLALSGGTMTGAIAMGTNKITGLGNPTADQDAATKYYVDSISAGINFHAAVTYATTTALPTVTYSNGTSGVNATLIATGNGALSIDGFTPTQYSRVLIKNQASAFQNGVYTVEVVGDGSTPFQLKRATDFNTAGSGVNQINAGDFFLVIGGTANANTSWVQQTPLPITMGSTSIVFAQFAAFTATTPGGSNTYVQYNNAGVFGGSSTFTYDGTKVVVPNLLNSGLTASKPVFTDINKNLVSTGTLGTDQGGTGLTSFTSGGALYATSTSALTTGTLPTASGGTGLTTFTSGGALYATSTSALATGTLPIASGGTNSTATPTAGGIGYGTGTAHAYTAAGTSGQTIISNAASAPTWGVLGTAGGGTGQSANLTQWGLVYANTTTSMASTTAGTAGQALVSNATSAPTWGTLGIAGGGTGLTSTPANGALDIGNGAGFTRTTLTQGSNIAITNGAGSISIAATPAGSTTQVQYNSGGTAFAGSANLTFNGTGLTSGYFIPSSSTVPTNGMYLSAANTVSLATNSTEAINIDSAQKVTIGASTSFANLGLQAAATGTATVNFIIKNSSTSKQVWLASTASGYTYGGIGGSEALLYATSSINIVADSGDIKFFANTGEKARFSSGGGLSVGTTSSAGAGGIYATGNITANFSDKRLKNVSGTIENALDKVGKLKGVYYTINETAKKYGYIDESVQVGVLTQDIELVLPEIIKAAPFDLDENNNSKSGNNYKTVQYERIVPLLIEAIKELKAELDMLKGVK
jgi:hypothetical protein